APAAHHPDAGPAHDPGRVRRHRPRAVQEQGDRSRDLHRPVTDVALSRPRLAVVASAAGCALLVARPLLLAATSHPVAVLAGLFALLLVAGWAWPARALAPSRRANAAAVIAIGLAAFVLGR